MLLNNLFQGYFNTDQWAYNLLKPLDFKSKRVKSQSGASNMIWQSVLNSSSRQSFGYLQMSINIWCSLSLLLKGPKKSCSPDVGWLLLVRFNTLLDCHPFHPSFSFLLYAEAFGLPCKLDFMRFTHVIVSLQSDIPTHCFRCLETCTYLDIYGYHMLVILPEVFLAFLMCKI